MSADPYHRATSCWILDGACAGQAWAELRKSDGLGPSVRFVDLMWPDFWATAPNYLRAGLVLMVTTTTTGMSADEQAAALTRAGALFCSEVGSAVKARLSRRRMPPLASSRRNRAAQRAEEDDE